MIHDVIHLTHLLVGDEANAADDYVVGMQLGKRPTRVREELNQLTEMISCCALGDVRGNRRRAPSQLRCIGNSIGEREFFRDKMRQNAKVNGALPNNEVPMIFGWHAAMLPPICPTMCIISTRTLALERGEAEP